MSPLVMWAWYILVHWLNSNLKDWYDVTIPKQCVSNVADMFLWPPVKTYMYTSYIYILWMTYNYKDFTSDAWSKMFLKFLLWSIGPTFPSPFFGHGSCCSIFSGARAQHGPFVPAPCSQWGPVRGWELRCPGSAKVR